MPWKQSDTPVRKSRLSFTAAILLLNNAEARLKRPSGYFAKCMGRAECSPLRGNGGSAADSLHIAGELVNSFRFKRRLSEADRDLLLSVSPEHGNELGNALEYGIPAVSMCGMPGTPTAIGNDIGGKFVFAQIAYGMLRP